jgi:hypothetical protein
MRMAGRWLVVGWLLAALLVRSSPTDELMSVFTRGNGMSHDYT